VAELLRGRDYGDADVHRAATQAASEIMRPGAALISGFSMPFIALSSGTGAWNSAVAAWKCFNTAVLVLGTVIASFFSE
jgi:hypothetical protein